MTDDLPEMDVVMRQTWQNENLLDYAMKDLDLRVKHDRTTKTSVLATGLSAFTDEPINLFLKGMSSIGKLTMLEKVSDIGLMIRFGS